ncbi:MAG: hypothetical protein WB676_19215 [Bryobacteraceae bacterium]
METRPDADYGTWSHPTLPLTVRYSLSLFHEVDFVVSEGYRRIAYGGIEHGGLLFGRASRNELQIEAFRQIELEHASGPAFLPSEGDVERIKEQIHSAVADPELAGLEPVGLFVSHSRRELQVEEAERQLLASLLLQGPRLLVLLKPEKFKPTSFAFVFPDESELNIFTLPSPVRPPRAKRKAVETPPEESPTGETAPSTKPKARRYSRKATVVALNEALPEPSPAAAPPPEPDPPALEAEAEPVVVPVRKIEWRILISAAAVSAILLLGCFLYFNWNFLEPPIDLHATAAPGHVTVSWLPEETAGTNEANLHIWSNHGNRTVTLSPAQRQAGEAIIAATGNDITIELVTHHWLHDRRGVLRVLTKR